MIIKIKNLVTKSKLILIFIFFSLNGCLYENQIELHFDKIKHVVINKSKSTIVKLEITKLNEDSSFRCTTAYVKLPGGVGLREINLISKNKGYKRYDSTCLFEKGFLYKIKGHSLHSVDTLVIRY